MTTKVEGFITKIFTKEGQGKRGPWALDNFLISDENGEEIGWFGNGFRDKASVPPKCKEGDYIRFEAEQDGQYTNIVKGTAVLVKDAPTPPPSKTPEASSGAQGGRQDSIVYQSSRKDAIELVKLLVSEDALPLTSAKTKAGQAKRFEELVAAVDQETVRFFNDVNSLRLLETVADTGEVDVSPDGDLPEAQEVNDEPESEDEPL